MYCSFCGKAQHQTKKIIVGPGVQICDACVNVCKTIIDRDNAKAKEDEFKPTGMTHGQFKIGQEFLTATGRWICTDKGKRTVVAMRLGGRDGTPSPLAVAEVELVFDESRFGECSPAKSAAKKPGR